MKNLIVSQEVFTYLKPTIVVMKYFGFAPITYKFENGSYTLTKSTKYVLYSYTIPLALGIWAFAGLYVDATSEFSFRIKSKNDIYVTLSDIGGVILSVFAGILLSPLKIEDLFGLIHSLDNINKLLKEGTEILKRDKRNSILFICIVYTVSTVIIALDLYSWSERTETAQLSVSYVKNYFSFYLFYFVLISEQLAYNNLVLHVKRRVMSLNSILQEEIIGKCEEEDEDFIFWIKTNENEMFNRKNEVIPIYPRNVNRIQVFAEAFEELWNCVESINKFFDYPLMLILITCFIHLIITIWGILVSYYTRWLFLIMNIVWIIVQGGRLFFVVEPIHSCLFEMSKTKPLVAKLVAEGNAKGISDQLGIIIKTVKILDLQFTAAGIVIVRRPMLTKIAAAVTTYLVLLYQLHSVRRVN